MNTVRQATSRWPFFFISIFLGIAAALPRFFQLGKDSLWCDEAGVARIILSPTPGEVLARVHSHIMAMPFDYLAGWFAARFSSSEFILRFPSVIWGISAVIAGYALYRLLAPEQVAIPAALLLVVSPLSIYFSQELRFYSALIFFYVLATLFALRAVKSDRTIDWVLFVFISAIGIYFHIYVVLMLVNLVIWALVRSRWSKGFFISVLFVVLIGISGYLLYGGSQNYALPLTQYNSFWNALGWGTGWLPGPYPVKHLYDFLFGISMFILFIVGAISSIRRRESLMIGLIVSILIQLGLIILTDWLRGYWFIFRQLIFLHPLLLLFSSKGLHALVETASFLPIPAVMRRFFLPVGLLFLLFLSIFPLKSYYRYPKSYGREISQYVISQWKPGDHFLTTYQCDKNMYVYYIDDVYRSTEIAETISFVSRERLVAEARRLVKAAEPSETIFLSVTGSFLRDESQQLNHLGFQQEFPDNTVHQFLIWSNKTP